MSHAARSTLLEDAPDCRRLPEPTVLRLVARAQRGDTLARERVILSFTPLAIHIAAKIAAKSKKTPGGPELSDMIQEALAAIAHAVDEIDLNSSGSLSGFFGVAATRAIIALRRRSTFTVHYPRSAHSFRMPNAATEISLDSPDPVTERPIGDSIAEPFDESAETLDTVTESQSIALRLICRDGERIDALTSQTLSRGELAQIARDAIAATGGAMAVQLPTFEVTREDLDFFEKFRALRAQTQLFAKLALVDHLSPARAAEQAGVAGAPSPLLLRLAARFHRWAAECSATHPELIARLYVVRELAVERLSDEQRQVLTFRHTGGLTVTGIAGALSIPRARARDQVASASSALTAQETLLLDLLAG